VLLGTTCPTVIRPIEPDFAAFSSRCPQRQRDGILTRLLHALAEHLRSRGKLDLPETFIDAGFRSEIKRARQSARLAEEKAVKS
jgi:hypothetical protein